MLPLARALADAGHDVAFATAGELGPSIEKHGFTAFPAGISLARQLEEAALRYPEAGMAPGPERFEAFVPRMLAGVAAPARARDLLPILDEWRPDVLVHDETEFGGPVAAARFGVPYAEQSVGILRPLAMARLAAEVLAPLGAEMGSSPGPSAACSVGSTSTCARPAFRPGRSARFRWPTPPTT
jgi:UDP:flavonoid glycosyltransferase YjiC (YdhE family)